MLSKCSNLIYLSLILSIVNLAMEPFISFNYLDECIVLFLAIIGIANYHIYKDKEFLITLSILILYFAYSVIIKSNSTNAILLDFIIIIKPFICYYVASKINTNISRRDAQIFKYISIGLGITCWLYLPFIEKLYPNTTAFYPFCISSAVAFLLFAPPNKNNKYTALLFLIPGLFSIRAKYYAEFIIFLYLFFFLHKRLKSSLTNIIISCCLIAVILYINWDKFSFYFIDGYEHGAARTFMYYTSFQIFADYFPFGSGYATFGTEAAARYYSHIYYEYDLHNIYGLRPEDYQTDNHFFSDTFYPVLAQFGIFGVILFLIFWFKIWVKGKYILQLKKYRLFLFIFITMTIQNIADTTFTNKFSIPIMIAIGILASKKGGKKIYILQYIKTIISKRKEIERINIS